MKLDLMKLWEQYKEHDDQIAREELIVHYSYLVKYIANRLAINLPSYVEVDELISDGIEGLIEAADKYDLHRKIKFETFASARIRGAMIDGLRAMDWVPVSIRQKSKELEKAYAHLESTLGRPAADIEVANELGLTMDKFHVLVRDASVTAMIYLEDLLLGEESASQSKRMIDLLRDDQAENPLEIIALSETKSVLAEAIRKLPEKEKIVLGLYYYEGLNLKEIGEVLNLSESRISQLHTKSIHRLRGRLSRKKSQMF
ncbi:MAG: FliA/WhiG family RNA polymerase sigma factor [Syntrophomonadaceae bacterium]|mgnify:CR=1 FL=1|nr:FliA/WhiG family RNA polymerase sigma factor [Syntrophomonadaceae bacterium]